MKPLTITGQITDRTSPSVMKYFVEVSKIPLLDKKEEYRLGMKAFKDSDEKAKEILIRSNLRFVISVAKQYYANNRQVPFGDLISAGNEGLIIAVDKFDPTRGFKLISYAVWWIRQQIINYLHENSRTIRTSARINVDMGKLNRLISDLEQKLGREPSVDEIFEHQDFINSDKAMNSLMRVKNTKVDSYDASLDTSGDSNYSILDKLSTDEDLPLDSILLKDTNKEILYMLNEYLNDRQRDVIIGLFGIGTETLSVNQLADKFDVGTASIINTRKLALRRLKYKLKNKQLDI